MAEYVFWYSDVSTYKAGFQASSKEEAEQLLLQVFKEFTLDIDDLPGFWEKHKSSEYEYDEPKEVTNE